MIERRAARPGKQEHSLPDEVLAAPVLVATPDAFEAMLATLTNEPVLALDTESDSLYRYYYKVCLIQISTPTTDYLVDPLNLPDISPLGRIFADPAVQKVFHAAENDILVLKRDFGFQFTNIFDTMLAARILGWPRVGLAALLAEHFGVTLDKRTQLTDWGRRPLTTEQLRYARLDSRYLLPLRDLQIRELQARHRWHEAQEAFAGLPSVEYAEKSFAPDGFWRIKGAKELRPRELAVLRELYLWRDMQARALDRPPFRVLTDQLLVRLSREQPRRLDELRLARRQVAQFGSAILAAIARGRAAPVPMPPSCRDNDRPDPLTLALFDQLRAWRAWRAAARGVDSDVILTNEALMVIARRAPATLAELASLRVMGPWKLKEYGAEILQVVADAKGRG